MGKDVRKLRLYQKMYEGHGVPNPELDHLHGRWSWVKSNGYPISMFGASWSTINGPTADLPIEDPKIYYHIYDPFNNRKKIQEVCRSMIVVYIWTYKPKAFCLVGSSSNGVERIFNYFRPKSLLHESRRAMVFFRNYGFKDIDLYIIPLSTKQYTINNMKLLEAYYIKELYTPLNVQREVYISSLHTDQWREKGQTSLSLSLAQAVARPKENNLQSLSKAAIPMYIFNKDNLKRVLYVFSSITKLKKEFQINLTTLSLYINKEGKFYLDLFYFTTKLPADCDLSNLIGIDELMELKNQLSPKKYYGRKGIELIDINSKNNSVASLASSLLVEHNDRIVFLSMSSLIDYIKLHTGIGVGYSTINKYAESGKIFRDKWIIKYIKDISSCIEGNLNISSTSSVQPSTVSEQALSYFS